MTAKKVQRKNFLQAGFTLIEVVLVLAIGGLIFLLTFIAFQQVATNRRDTQRRADAKQFQTEVQNYMTNQGIGATPPLTTTQFNTLKDNYLNALKDPGTNQPYTITFNSDAPTSPENMMLRYSAGGRICDTSEASTATGANPINYVIFYYLERGGRQCLDNR